MFLPLRMVFVALFLLAVAAAPARGTLVTFAFSGVVLNVADRTFLVYPDLVREGSPFWGTFTFDTNTPNATPENPWRAEYDNAIVHIEGQVGALTFSEDFPTFGRIAIDNDMPFGNPNAGTIEDTYSVRATLNVLGKTPLLALGVRDYTGAALSSLELPTTPPPWEAFDSWSFQFIGGGFASIIGELQSLTLVPEPGGLAMLGLGAAALMARRRRRRT